MRKTGIESIDKANEKLEELQRRSDEAPGLVGKLISLPHADGYAYYTVEQVKGTNILLEWHEIGDAWHDNILGAGGWFPKKQIEPIVRQQSEMESIFKEHGKKAQNAGITRMLSVAAAALSDLGEGADIYALAHWCYERGQRGKLFMKDKRIAHFRKVMGNGPFADDLAYDLHESGKFPVLEGLKKTQGFVMLADALEDPLLYKKAPPAKEEILAKVQEGFQKRLGVAPSPEAMDLAQEYPDDPASTSFVVKVNGKAIGSVCYDVKDGSVVAMNVEFEHEFKGKR